MMMNLFSIFDPTSILFLSLNWLSMLIMLFFLPFHFWMSPSRHTHLWNLIIMFLFQEFKVLINQSYSNIVIFLSLFFLIFFNNFLGLFPYIFTSSSHMNFCFSLSLSLWISMLIFSIFNYLNILLAHLTPSGTPPILMPFMVIIESISLMIRPLTLAIRLSANMIAGHLLLTLLGTSGMNINNLHTLVILIFIQILLITLEMAVSIIQAYVFSILSILYSKET